MILTGPSGSGKTTLLTLIGALRSTQEGSLKVRTTSWAPEDGGILKKTLARHWTGLSAAKNKLSGH